MNTLAFVSRLKNNGIDLWVEGEELCFRARAGAMTDPIKHELRSRKQDILRLLGRCAKVTERQQQTIPAGTQTDTLSPAQEGLWFMERLQPGGILYLIPMAFHLQGPLDQRQIEDSLFTLILRHDSLRMGFTDQRGRPTLCMNEQPIWHLSVIDLTSLSTDVRLAHCRVGVGSFSRIPFNLSKPPLFRATLFHLGDEEHVLAMCVHHLVFDGWSMGILMDELSKHYNASLVGFANPLPPWQVSYRDYAYWKKERLDQSELQDQLNWWKNHLAGVVPVTLPGDRPRPARITYRGGNVHVLLPPTITGPMTQLMRGHQLSLFHLIAASFLALLYRYTGHRDLTLGAAMGNRNHREIEAVIGLFVNLVTLRIDMAKGITFRQLLTRVQAESLVAFQNGDVPFERVVETIGASRDSNSHPLFNFQVVLANGLVQSIDMSSLQVAPFHWGSGVVARKDLTLLVGQYEGDIICDLEYNRDLFDQNTVTSLMRHFGELMRHGVQAPDTPVDRLDLITDLERATIHQFNQTRTAYPREHTLHRLFELQTRQTPNTAALVDDSGTLTYAELNARANRLAGFLWRRGVRPGQTVGLCLQQCFDRIAAILGILKLGGIYVPLDARYPRSRLAFMLEDTACDTVVAERGLLRALPRETQIIVLERERDALAAEQADNIRNVSIPSNAPAYIMYTSGSTGRPKGVMINHRNVIRLAKNNPMITLGPKDVFLQAASVSFDASTFEIWTPLLNGSKLVLMASHAIDELPLILERHKVSILWLSAQLFHMMVDRHLTSMESVKQLLAGGEALSTDHVRRYLDRFPDHHLINGYGPTENTTFTCFGPLHKIGLTAFSAPIGTPIANTTAYVLDKQMRSQPPAIQGELFTGGDGLAIGYLNQPAQTAEHFVPNPFSKHPGTRLYRTGDRARLVYPENLTTPVLEYMGRFDRQIKLRGFRIEPGEIERAIKSSAEVEDAYLLLHPGAEGDRFLAAYVVVGAIPFSEYTRIKRQLSETLNERLPNFMIPRSINLLPALPLTVNGKVDRAKLPEPELVEQEAEEIHDAPRTPVEELLAGIWCNLLGIEALSREDNFFDQGGHSLLANRLMGEVMETFQLEFPVRTIFEFPTLRELAARIEAARRETPDFQLPPILPLTRPEDEETRARGFALSFAQERLWFLDRLQPGSAMYSVPIAVRMRGTLFKDTLKACFNEIVRRHENLRTRFTSIEGVPRQIIDGYREIPFSVVDLRNFPAEEREAECMHRMTEVAHIPFALEDGQLLRLVLYRLQDNLHIMLMNMHHIVSDGWSLKLLFREVAQLYGAYAEGKSSPLEPLSIQFVDYAAWQREWLTGELLDAQFEFWRVRLADAPTALELPLDLPRPKVQTFRGAGFEFMMSDHQTRLFQDCCRQYGVTPFMTLIAAYACLLSRYTSQDDLCIGTPIANRNHHQTQNLIGFFLNTLVFRMILREPKKEELTFEQLLARTRIQALDAYAHQELPFEQLVGRLQHQRDMSRSPLFQTAFSWDSETTDTEIQLPGLVLNHQAFDYRIAKFDLSLGMGIYQERLYGSFGYNVDLFLPATICRLMHHFQNLLVGLLENPRQSIFRLDPLSPEEQRALLEDFNNTERARPPLSVREMVEAIVRTDDARTACIWGDIHLSYGDLNRRANRLAHYLIGIGVGPGVAVAVCLDPCPELVIAQLAILKAGGAFIPLDPNYPIDRLVYMLDDSGVSVVLSRKAIAETMPEHSARVIQLDRPGAHSAGSNPAHDENPPLRVSDQLPAYIIYTSGSTGQPKGVVIPESGFRNLVVWHQRAFALSAEDRATKLAHVGFDASVWEVWPYLSIGASMYLAATQLLRNPGELVQWLVKHGITICFLPTPVAEVLITMQWPSQTRLRYLLTGGDQLHHFPAPHLPFKVVNNYGPTENTVVTTSGLVGNGVEGMRTPPIGTPIHNVQIYLLDRYMTCVPPGVPGELYIGGIGLAQGYLGQVTRTAKAFVPNPFSKKEGERLYRTGDLVRLRHEQKGDTIEFLGRIGRQVKLRGFRIELGEIEHHLREFPGVADAVVLVAQLDSGEKKLVGYVQVPESGLDIRELREYVSEKLPYYMVPGIFVVLERFPMTPNGKVDHRALASARQLSPSNNQERYEPPKGRLERKLTQIWSEVLGLEKVGAQTNFFDLGGHSLLLTRVQSKMEEILKVKPDMVELFQYPTIRALVNHLLKRGVDTEDLREALRRADVRKNRRHHNEDRIAVVGYAGRFPGAPDVATFWRNLCDGVESIETLEPEKLRAGGVSEALLQNADYVPRGAFLDQIDHFDAAFFDMTPREAETMDPQHRLFLEQAWRALEHAGYNPEDEDLSVGLYAGAGLDGYLLNNLLPATTQSQAGAGLSELVANDGGFLATRVSYKLNLKGPSVNLQTACSTSLVAVHMACQSLLNGECDLALAGGVALQVPQQTGYLYREGLTLSADGHCRAFDAAAGGTVRGSGLAIAVLKRFSEAMRDGDTIYAAIKGTAINNDGSCKAGFMAPSVKGQEAVIREALAVADIDPETVGYVEAHGTATRLGDPIEVRALVNAFRMGGASSPRFLGSVKTNLGHLDAAAGIAGFLKVVLCLHYKQIPPSLHYTRTNPEIDFGGLFTVNTRLRDWPERDDPHRAGVSSFGIGGTNVHAVLESVRDERTYPQAESQVILPLSARSKAALEQMRIDLAHHLEDHPGLNLADVAHTLGVGRKAFPYRLAHVADSRGTTIAQLRDPNQDIVKASGNDLQAVFLFPGQGSQYLHMGRGLYRQDPLFRKDLDACAEMLRSLGGEAKTPSLTDLLYPGPHEHEAYTRLLDETLHTQPAIFAIGWCCARWWMRRGVMPSAMVGHSLGEYVAATIAGVFSIRDALSLVSGRAQLMQTLPPGGMLAVGATLERLEPLLPEELCLAAVNGPKRLVVSGPAAALAEFERFLSAQRIQSSRLATSHAFHSKMVQPAADAFRQMVLSVKRNPPNIPFLSNKTGTWITADEATDSAYWAQHMCDRINFLRNLRELARKEYALFLEVGPGKTLSSFCRSVLKGGEAQILPTLSCHPEQEWVQASTTLARIWTMGFSVNWNGHRAGKPRRRLPLPGHPFQRKRFWVDPPRIKLTPVRAEDTILPVLESLRQLNLFSDEVNLGDLANKVQAHLRGEGEIMNETAVPEPPPEPMEANPTMVDALLEIWRDVLGHQDISPEQCFSDLGGDSLAITQVHARLQSLSIACSVEDLFDYDQLSELAAFLEPTARQSQSPNLLPLPNLTPKYTGIDWFDEQVIDAGEIPTTIPRTNNHEGPLSFSQERLWFFERLVPGTPCYNMPGVLELNGPLCIQAMEAVLNLIAKRHPMLRTRLSEENGETWQTIAPHVFTPLPVLDLSALLFIDGEHAASRTIEQFAHASLCAEHSTPWRLAVLRLSESHHYLVWNVHHLLFDGWSLKLFLGELCTAYTAFLSWHRPALSPLPVNFLDYARWQRSRQGDVLFEARIDRAVERLREAPAHIHLPHDKTGATGAPRHGRTLTFDVPGDLTEQLKTTRSELGVTPFMALIAVYGVLLSRYSGQTLICVGTPLANRKLLELEPMIGYVANTAAILIDIGHERRCYADFLQAIRGNILATLADGDVPLELLVERLNPERNPNEPPLFQVFFSLENTGLDREAGGIDLPGLETAFKPFDFDVSNFHLELGLTQFRDGFQGRLRYNTERFCLSTAKRLIDHFITLARGLIARPHLPMCDVSMMSAGEWKRVLTLWEDPGGPTEPMDPLQMIARHALEQGQRTALAWGKQKLSFHDLNVRVNRLAGFLQSRGLVREQAVLTLTPRHPWFAITALAILKAGGAWVPLESNITAHRLAALIEDTRPLLLLQYALDVPPSELETVALQDDPDGLDDYCVSESESSESQTAYIIFTSGSSGTPKGVIITRASLANHAYRMATHYQLTPEDRVFQINAPGFDLACEDLFPTLLAGAQLVFPCGEEPIGLADLIAQMNKAEVSVVNPTTAFWHEWSLYLESGGTKPGQSLRLVIAGAQEASLARYQAWRGHVHRKVRWANGYGPTESTITATSFLAPANWEPDCWGIPIGQPVAGARCYICDAYLFPCGLGLEGELLIGGPGLARGYLGRPGLTAERFVPDPFGKEAGARLYRSGDLVRTDGNERLVFRGRLDRQLKVRGYRVEPGEVETCLRQLPGISDAYVSSSGGSLIAHVEGRGTHADPQQLTRFARQQLPGYMVPSQFVVMLQFPRTNRGKIDIDALPTLSNKPLVSNDQPRDQLEHILCQLFGEVLQHTCQRTTHFFEAGGHSLLAMRLMASINVHLNRNLPLKCLFESPTPERLAEALRAESEDAKRPPILARPADDLPQPLSYEQERFWFIYQQAPESSAYHIPMALYLKGPLCLLSLNESVVLCVERHQTLRTLFLEREGKAYQRIIQLDTLPMSIVDLSSLDSDLAKQQTPLLLQHASAQPFNPMKAPPWRLVIFHLSPQRHVLLWCCHHLITDGWSLDLLMDECSRLYNAKLRGDSPTEPRAPYQYIDYAHWQRQWLRGEVLEAHLRWWAEFLETVLEPSELPRYADGKATGADVFHFSIDEALVERACRGLGLTPFMFYLTAFGILLCRHARVDHCCLGVPVAGRDRTELAHMQGLLINTLPMPFVVGKNQTVVQTLSRVRRNMLDALMHAEAPLEKIVEYLKLGRDRPLFQVLFDFATGAVNKGHIHGIRSRLIPLKPAIAKFKLNLVINHVDQKAQGAIQYDVSHYGPQDVANMAEQFNHLLRQMAESPNLGVHALSLMDGETRRQILTRWLSKRFTEPKTMVHLFHESAIRHPHAKALSAEDQVLSYGRLGRKAEQLAAAFAARGVKAQEVVGLLFPRGLDQILALLAIMRTGATYLPLDVDLPRERIAYMLRDAGVSRCVVAPTHAALCPADIDPLTIEKDLPPTPPTMPMPDGAMAAYIIYTSGSTGKPKGVIVSHGSCVNLYRTMAQHIYQQTRPLRVSLNAPIYFDASVQQLVRLGGGDTLCLVPENARKDVTLLKQWLLRERIQVLDATPSLWQVLVEAGIDSEDHQLEKVLLGGEEVPEQVWRYFAGHPKIKLYNIYGPTEACVNASAAFCDRELTPVHIGTPLFGHGAFVLDDQLNPVPDGIPGQLFLSGNSLALGYWNKSLQTAWRFIPHPYSTEPGERLYRSGDLVRVIQLSHGPCLQFMGRVDRQLKLRGYRLELDEMVVTLESHPEIDKALVLPSEHAGQIQLIAFIQATRELGTALTDFLAQKLPQYMVPQRVIPIVDWPLTQNGKLDKSRLLEMSKQPQATATAAPYTPIETRLRLIWTVLLRQENISIEENLFTLGAHSLLVMQVAIRITRIFGLKLPIRSFFRYPTIKSYAAYLDALLWLSHDWDEFLEADMRELTP